MCLVLLTDMPGFPVYLDFQNVTLGLHVACLVIIGEFLVIALLLYFALMIYLTDWKRSSCGCARFQLIALGLALGPVRIELLSSCKKKIWLCNLDSQL